jgi:hypothetical protein
VSVPDAVAVAAEWVGWARWAEGLSPGDAMVALGKVPPPAADWDAVLRAAAGEITILRQRCGCR